MTICLSKEWKDDDENAFPKIAAELDQIVRTLATELQRISACEAELWGTAEASLEYLPPSSGLAQLQVLAEMEGDAPEKIFAVFDHSGDGRRCIHRVEKITQPEKGRDSVARVAPFVSQDAMAVFCFFQPIFDAYAYRKNCVTELYLILNSLQQTAVSISECAEVLTVNALRERYIQAFEEFLDAYSLH